MSAPRRTRAPDPACRDAGREHRPELPECTPLQRGSVVPAIGGAELLSSDAAKMASGEEETPQRRATRALHGTRSIPAGAVRASVRPPAWTGTGLSTIRPKQTIRRASAERR